MLKLTEMKEPIPFYSHHIYLSPPYTDFPHTNDSWIITIENSVHFCHRNLFDIFDSLTSYLITHLISQLLLIASTYICATKQFISQE